MRRAWSIVVAGVLLVPGLAPVEQAQAVSGAESGVMMAPDSGMTHAATSAPASVLPSQGGLASSPVAPACPPMSSLCNPEGLAVLALAEGLVATGAVVNGGVTAGKLIVGSGSSDGPGVETETLSMPQTQEGWVASSIVNRQLNPNRVAWEQYPNSTSQTAFTVVDPPAWGATSGVITVDWQASWAGLWTTWSESGQIGLRVKCRNGDTWGSTSDVGATRGLSPGGPGTQWYKGAGTFTPLGTSPSSLCPAQRDGFDSIEAIDGYDGTVLAKYYPPGHPDRPDPVSRGLGTVTRWVDCVDGNGVHTKIYDLWSVDLLVGGTFDLPALTCPAGSRLDQTGVDWSPQADPSITDVLVPPVLNPNWIVGAPEDYPDCFTTGADCRLDLWDRTGAATQWCGFLATDCPYWYVDPQRAAHYGCQWGPYEVDLSICSVFRDPGRILPNAFVDASGVAHFLGFVDLALNTWVVKGLVGELTDRYATEQAGCEAFGEAVRDHRSFRTKHLNIPDVVWDCTEHGIQDALYYITVTGGDIVIAVSALAASALFSPPPTVTRPDCDQLSSGACVDPKPSVTIDTQEWATGPKEGPSPEQAATALETCTSLVQTAYPALNPTEVQGECESKPIFVPGGKAGAGKEAAVHDLAVIAAHPSLVQLWYISNKEKEKTGVDRRWYYTGSGYLPPCTGKVAKYKIECDEYPYYSSTEGGQAAYNVYGQGVLDPIDWKDNRIEGAALYQMYRDPRCNMTSAVASPASPGSPYLVVPLPETDVASFYLCLKD